MHITTYLLLALTGLNLFDHADCFSVHLRRPFKSLTRIQVVAPQRKVEKQLQIYNNGDSSAVVPITEMIKSAGKNLPTMVSMFFAEGKDYLHTHHNVSFLTFTSIFDYSLFAALLLNAAVILGFLFSVDVLRFETTTGFFNKELWKQVMPLFVALLTGSFLTTIVPFEPFKTWGRQARFASLQAWGLTDTWTSLYGHAFVSALSGM